MKSLPDSKNVFYVYILFDELGVPRYVGKGKGNRWNQHENETKRPNWLKNIFIQRTLRAIGEIPKVKISENMNESDAFALEAAFIKALGRYPLGPLVNLTDKRNGPSSETIAAWHASRTTEERSATARKSRKTDKEKTCPDLRRARYQKAALSQGREALSERMTKFQADRSIEERANSGRLGGLASSAACTAEQLVARSAAIRAYCDALSPEERKEFTRKLA